jgi:hypothetical protein
MVPINHSRTVVACAPPYDYGFLPPRFFNQVLEAFGSRYQAGKRRLTPRE